jgi:hypothetical protein
MATNNDLCGWLEQQGDKALLKTWRRRWFAQKGDYLYYFKSPDDKQPINYISLQRLEAPVKLSPNSTTRFELRVRSHANNDEPVNNSQPINNNNANNLSPTASTANGGASLSPQSSSSSLTTALPSSSSLTTPSSSEHVLLRLRASTPEEAQFWLAGSMFNFDVVFPIFYLFIYVFISI